jgi:hypothetical protein
LVGLQVPFVDVQVPLVDGGQSASAKHAAYKQLEPLLLQVFWLQEPAWGAQSVLDAQSMPSNLQVLFRHWVSEKHTLPDWTQEPLATPPRQLAPSVQSTPTSVEVSNDPPGTPVNDPDVSNTTNMLGWCIWRAISVSGLSRAVAESVASNKVATKAPIVTAKVTLALAVNAR